MSTPSVKRTLSQRFRSKRSISTLAGNSEDKSVFIELLPSETAMMKMVVPSTGLLTFFEVVEDFPETWLYNRLNNIVKLNPWLNSRLVTTKDKGICLNYSRNETFKGFTTKYQSGVTPSLSFEDLGYHPALLDEVVPSGRNCVDKDIQLFKVGLFKQGTKSIGVLITMSHILGDGNTIYSIFKMLDHRHNPKALVVEREFSYEESLRDAMGHKEYKWHQKNTTKLGIVKNITDKKHTMSMQIVEDNYVQQQKADFTKNKTENSPLFISTNDIICSGVFSEANVDFASIFVDFRGRLPNVTADLAGNYSHEVIFCRDEFSSPENFRKVIQSINRREKNCPELPSARSRMAGKSAFITDWSSFYHHLEIEGCVNVVHMPFYPAALAHRVPWKHGSILYRPNPSERCLFIVSNTLDCKFDYKIANNVSCLVSKKSLSIGDNAPKQVLDSDCCLRAAYSHDYKGNLVESMPDSSSVLTMYNSLSDASYYKMPSTLFDSACVKSFWGEEGGNSGFVMEVNDLPDMVNPLMRSNNRTVLA